MRFCPGAGVITAARGRSRPFALALGFACHFGLGLFVPIESNDSV